MPLSFPWEAFIQAQNAKTQNRRDMYGDIAGLGQGLGQGIGAVGEAVAKHKQEQQLKAMIDQLLQGQSQSQPVQGPQLPMPPNTMGATGAQPLGNQMQPGPSTVDPVMKMILPFVKNNPSLLPQVLPALAKGAYQSRRPGKTGGTDYQWATLADKQANEAQRQKNFQEMMQFRSLLADLSSAKTTKEIKEKIQAWQGSNTIKSLFGFGPTEESVGVGDGGETSDDGWGDVQVSP